jgi:hypothetical protein
MFKHIPLSKVLKYNCWISDFGHVYIQPLYLHAVYENEDALHDALHDSMVSQR